MPPATETAGARADSARHRAEHLLPNQCSVCCEDSQRKVPHLFVIATLGLAHDDESARGVGGQPRDGRGAHACEILGPEQPAIRRHLAHQQRVGSRPIGAVAGAVAQRDRSVVACDEERIAVHAGDQRVLEQEVASLEPAIAAARARGRGNGVLTRATAPLGPIPASRSIGSIGVATPASLAPASSVIGSIPSTQRSTVTVRLPLTGAFLPPNSPSNELSSTLTW